MTAPDYRAEALTKALSKIAAGTKPVERTSRQKASAFHKLAMDTLRPAINFRRQIWKREARGFGPSGSRFNAFDLTPHTLRTILLYRMMAQKFRRQARFEEMRRAA
jgi:hypothetical protein